MERRALLRVSVKLGLLGVAAAFAGVFVQGLFGPGLLSDDVIELGGIPPGSARLASWNGKPVWVVNRSTAQQSALAGLSSYVIAAESEQAPVDGLSRSLRPSRGIYLAETGRSGILVQYTRERPRKLPDGVPWHGGFVDPGSDAVFDVAGRRYCSTRGAPLAVPPHRYIDDGAVRLGEW